MIRDRRLDVQGLRALAVGVVVADHAGVPVLGGGFVGVDVFFVVSGFLITSLLVREADATGRPRLLDFYARRARRILPAATVVLVAVLAFTATALSYVRVERTADDVGWAAAFLANVRFSRLGTDYFAEGLPPSPVQHYWSLAVEEQFYLAWPPLLVVLVLAARRGGRTTPWPVVGTVVGLLTAASFGWSVLQLGDDATVAYFSSLGRAWELGVGVLLALAVPLLARLGPRTRAGLATAGLAAVAAAAGAYDAATPFPGVAALLPVLGTAALLAAGTGGDAVGPARVLTWRPLTWVGDVSYSWYLWHWPVLVLAEARAGEPLPPGARALLVALSLGLATLTYHLVENPVRRPGWFGRGAARGRVRALALWPTALALVAAAALGAAAVGEQRLADRLDGNRQYAALRDDSLPVRQQLALSLAQADRDEPVAFPLTDLDQLDEVGRDVWTDDYPCAAAQGRARVDLCAVGDPDGGRTMVVVGDSKAGQWLPALDAIGRESGYRVVPLVKFGCTPYDVPLTTGGRAYTECTDFRAWARRTATSLHPDVVVVTGRVWQGNTDLDGDDEAEAWAEGYEATLGQLAAVTDRLVVISDISALAVDPLECLVDPAASMATCTTPEDDVVVDANRELAAAAAGRASYVDVQDLTCETGRCPAVAGGLMVYGNPSHVSASWSRRVAAELARRLQLPR